MSFASDIDAAVARLERAGGLPSVDALSPGQVTPELVKRYQRRAQELRAEAQVRFMSSLFTAAAGLPLALLRGNLDAPFKRRQRLAAEPTVWTLG